MLIEFSISNFRSFRDRQTLSMVAAPRLRRKENTFDPELPGEDFPALLKSVAIYGPNASGKSNLVQAFRVITGLAGLVPQPTRQQLPVAPFRFDPALAKSPSRFELHFAFGGMRYQMTLALTKERVEEESLCCFPKGSETLLYARKYTHGRDSYEFGDTLEGGQALHDAWSKLTAPDRLFLAQAVANSSEELRQLRAPLSWLTMRLLIMAPGPPDPQRTLKSLSALMHMKGLDGTEAIRELTSFIHDLDIPVTRLRLDSEQEGAADVRAVLTHRTASGEALFDFDDESTGTQNLIGFYLPWFVLQASKNEIGCSLVADELDTSLHPNIVAELVRRHNLRGGLSQLIFTSHDTHLMDTKLLRRDQIWLTERDANGATQLRSVHDFEGRESEDVEKRYYEGRYRGLPIVRKE